MSRSQIFLMMQSLLVLALWPGFALAASPPLLQDGPVAWYAADDTPIPLPAFEEPGLVPYAYQSFVSRPFSRFFHPGRFVRWVGQGDRGRPAGSVNALDEVVNSTWFTNRHGLRPMTDEELVTGPGLPEGPDRSQPWTIIGAKTSGVTPGFRIRDGKGDVWLLKFDPAEQPGMGIRSGVVTNLIFHAIGYHVPVDRLVTFDRRDLVVAEGVTMKLQRNLRATVTEANLDSLLQATHSVFNGRYQALASRYLDGTPLGPFDVQDTRLDDPNDLIPHQDRRELRGLRVFAAWVNHFDTKMHNSLDMYVGPEGQGHVKHYLIDFASTLGACGDEPVKRFGYEFGVDVFPFLGRMLALGLHEDAWVSVNRPPGLPEVGLFVAEPFAPEKWKPDMPHTAMAHLTRYDGYWAAKIVSAFTDDQLRLLVEQGGYTDSRSVDYLTATLAARRDKIARHWFDLVPPLDFFLPGERGVRFTDLARERGYAGPEPARYRYRIGAVDAERHCREWFPWTETDTTWVPFSDVPALSESHPFRAVECQVFREGQWSSSTTVYLGSRAGRVIALDR
jgi:hypothetical protein|nr:hypothetical protein [Candidatus Krumholzibacteria bacterium]